MYVCVHGPVAPFFLLEFVVKHERSTDVDHTMQRFRDYPTTTVLSVH